VTVGGDWLFGGLILLACFITWYSGHRKNFMMAFIGFGLWFSLFMWLFFSPTPVLNITAATEVGDYWIEILMWVFLLLAFLPLVLQIDTEITRELKGRRWKEFGSPPKEEGESEYDRYMREFRRRLRGR